MIVMDAPQKNPAIRQGQFLGMDKPAQRNYLSSLKKKIEDGYYFSEKVISRIVEEIDPVMNDVVDHDGVIQ